MMIKKYILNGLLAPILVLCLSTSVFAQSKQLADNFDSPPKEYRPETWFHLIGNNISKEGLTKDLEAIKYAGIGGMAKPFLIAHQVGIELRNQIPKK